MTTTPTELMKTSRVVSAFIVLLVVAGTLIAWNAPRMDVDEEPMVAMFESNTNGFIEEPEAVLVAWAEARAQ